MVIVGEWRGGGGGGGGGGGAIGSNGGNFRFETGEFRVDDATGSGGFFGVEEKGSWEVGNWVRFVVWAGLG